MSLHEIERQQEEQDKASQDNAITSEFDGFAPIPKGKTPVQATQFLYSNQHSLSVSSFVLPCHVGVSRNFTMSWMGSGCLIDVQEPAHTAYITVPMNAIIIMTEDTLDQYASFRIFVWKGCISWGYSRRDGKIFCEYAVDSTGEHYETLCGSVQLRNVTSQKTGVRLLSPPCTISNSLASVVAERLGHWIRTGRSAVSATLEAIELPWKSNESYVEQTLQQNQCQTSRTTDGRLVVQVPKGTEVKGWRRPKQGKESVYWSFIFRLNGGATILKWIYEQNYDVVWDSTVETVEDKEVLLRMIQTRKIQ